MIPITKDERRSLESVGLLKHSGRLKNGERQDSNFTVVNKYHKSRGKVTYVVETPEVLAFLGKFDMLNLQKIRPDQLQILKDKCHVTEDNIQNYGEYKPNATVYITDKGIILCKKITNYMVTVGIWKNNKI